MSADTAGLIVRQGTPKFNPASISNTGKATEIPWNGLSKEELSGDIFTGDPGLGI